MSGALLLFALLLTNALAPPAAEKAVRLAALGVAALLAPAVFATGAVRSALGPFASALHLTVGLALVLGSMALTGGAGSELYPLLLIDVALARALLGGPAARFLTVATMAGLLGLAALGGAVAAPPLGLVIRVLGPLALLGVLEAAATARRDGAPQSAGGEPGATRTATDEPSRGGIPSRPEGAAGGRGEPAAAGGPGATGGGGGSGGADDAATATGGERSGIHSRGASRGSGGADYRPPQLIHDLKSPLTVVRLYADILADQARRGEAASTEHVANLRSELAMMESLLERGSTPGEPTLQRADLVKILGELAASYRAAHAGRLRIEFMAEQAELPVMADVLAVRRAFRNVLDNAVKYTLDGGQVRIRAGEREGRAFVVVSDTGLGMSAADRERAFEVSFRGAGARGEPGQGLGLGLTRELLAAQGGTVSLASEAGRGSDVTIQLPLAGGQRR